MPGGASRVRIANDGLTAIINTLGAELSSLKTADGNEWLWQGDSHFWSGRAPILFPVVGRSPGGHVTIDGRAYPMSSHGFARQSAFEIVDAGGTQCRLRLTEGPTTRLSFPFPFRLEVLFSLETGALRVALEISNTGEHPLPCSFGLHPGFVWPLPGSSGRSHFIALDDHLEPEARRLDVNGMMLPGTGQSIFRTGRLSLGPETFLRGAIFMERGWGTGLSFGIAEGPEIKIETEGFPDLGLWTRPGAPFLCIEPCCGLPPAAGADALEARPGAIQIPPGGIRVACVAIKLRPSGGGLS